jgi:hypothetical protein
MRWILALAVAAGCTSSEVSRTLGARCDRSDECDERCLVDDATDWPGGFCTISCDDDRACPGNSRCVAELGGVCLVGCATDDDCRFLGETWGCVQAEARPEGQVMVCRGD